MIRLFKALGVLSVLTAGQIVMAGEGPAPDQRASVQYTTPSVSIVVPKTGKVDYANLFTQYDAAFNNGRGMSDADNTNGQLAWLQSYQMLAYMRMYEATSNTLWLDRVSEQFARLLECRDDKIGRKDVHAGKPLKGWGTATYDKAGWHVFVVHTGMICQGPAEFIRLVMSTPALKKDYGSTASVFLKELESMIDEANLDFKTNAAGEGWYNDPAMGIVPLNMSNAMGSVMVELYHINGRTEYRAKAKALALYFKNSIKAGPDGTANWLYWPRTSSDKVTKGEDISHAALNVDFAARCVEAGLVFTGEDMERFANTWLKVVKQDSGTWADYVDGSQGPKPGVFIPQAPGRWMSIVPWLNAETRKNFVADIQRAFAGQDVLLPSRGVGLANLALYR